QLNSLGDLVDQFILLFVVFVVEKMELIKRWARNLPVGFLVQIAESDRVREQLVELFGHFQSNGFLKVERQQMFDGAVSLKFACFLVQTRLCTHSAATGR